MPCLFWAHGFLKSPQSNSVVSQLLSCPFVQLPVRIDANRLKEEIDALSPECWTEHRLPNLHSIPLVSIAEFKPKLCDVLQKLPYLSAILTSWKAPLGESRISILGPNAKVPCHVDVEHYWKHRWRVHIVVQSNPDALFGCDHQIMHLPAGEVWVSNNWAPHWIENRGKTNRIHIVIDTLGSSVLSNLIEQGWRSDTDVPRPTTESLPLLTLDQIPPIDLVPENYSKLDIRTPSEVEEIVEDTLNELDRSLPTSQRQELRSACQSFQQQWQDRFERYGHTRRRQYLTCLHHLLTSVPNVQMPNRLTFKQIFNRQIGASLTPIPQLHVHLFWTFPHDDQNFLDTLNQTTSLVTLSSNFKVELQNTFFDQIKSHTLLRPQFLERLVGALQHPISHQYWIDRSSHTMSPSLNLWIDINQNDRLSDWQEIFPQNTTVVHIPHPKYLQPTTPWEDLLEYYQSILDHLENQPNAHWIFLLHPHTRLSKILDIYNGNLNTLPHSIYLDKLHHSTLPEVSTPSMHRSIFVECRQLYEQLMQRLQPHHD